MAEPTDPSDPAEPASPADPVVRADALPPPEPADEPRPAEHPDHAEVPDAPDSGDVDAQVPWRVFAFVGAFVAVLFAIYAATSGDAAGSSLLAVASILGLFCGLFLWRGLRRFEAPGPTGGPDDPSDHPAGALYLPDASPWPFGIGLGVVLVLNGLLIGTWFLVPGGMVLAVALAGFARQSRHRS
jgi:hypothetical protein